jgi:outer membrane protein assembly factor BamB
MIRLRGGLAVPVLTAAALLALAGDAVGTAQARRPANAVLSANRYTAAARRFAEALIEHGRDHYGPRHTPLWVHTLDLRTLEIPRQRTAAEWRTEMAGWREDRNYQMWGKDRSSVAWAQDSNLLWDTDAIRLFDALSRDSGDARFAAAANAYMRYFLDHAVSQSTGLFAWGEHVAYNVADDVVRGKRHELQHADPPWEELWRLDPGKVRNEIEAVYRYHVTDKRSMAFDRHADYIDGLPERDQATILGYAGVYANAFAFLSTKTGEAKYLDWARKLFLAFQSKSNADGLYPDNWTDRQSRELPLAYPVRPQIAADLYRMYERTGDNRWLCDANQYLEACARRPVETPGPFIDAALRAYRANAERRYLEMARQAGEAWARSPQPKAQMAGQAAERIVTLLKLYETTGEERWLSAARESGDYAIQAFVHSSGLIRGTAVVDRPDYYDAIQGSGSLAWALYRLGAARPGAAPQSPRPRNGDTTPPEIGDRTFPAAASNQAAVPIVVRIRDASGVARAALHYAYGNEIGFVDAAPQVAGDRYTFHIAPPGVAFLGEAAFAVEAVDASANHNSTISRWSRLRLFSEEKAPAVAPLQGGEVRFPALGVTLAGGVTLPAGSAVRVMRQLPEGAAPQQAPWVSIGRYVAMDAGAVRADRITIEYAPEEAWRLIESTLALAYWSDSRWVRVPSEIDSAHGRVSGKFTPAAYWTLVGEDRVLWRAPGRETGAALADFEGDGTFDVLTTIFRPGELLSAWGKPLKQFPIDAPYRPIQNYSEPAVAVLRAGEPPLALIGAPSGYVYAFDRQGTRHWRCEVGGEILGAIAVGRLLDGPDLAVAASWNGGIAVIDAQGRKVWERALAEPSGATPVLVDLDGDGRMEIAINAGSRLLALDGRTGGLRWEFRTASGGVLVTPAVGEFIRGRPPRMVTGDDQGAVYAIDESGRLLWRQDRLYGPREVPEPAIRLSGISEIGLAGLDGSGERQVIVTTRSGETVALGIRGERRWRFASYERKVGVSYGGGAHLAFADLDGDGMLEVILSQQDSYLYVLDAAGRQKWCYLGYFWYHTRPAVADLLHTGELNIVFTSPEEGGTYALRSGHRAAQPQGAPWPMSRGGLARTNCAPW